MNPKYEARFSNVIGRFLLCFNARVTSGRILEGQEWVRVRPPSREELEDRNAPTKFKRPGTLVTITFLNSSAVTVVCAGDNLTMSRQDFLSTFTRIVQQQEWKS